MDTAKGAAKAQDGKTYGVPDGTDTRGLWYNKQIFAKAGLPADWQPKTWDDVLTAARTIKQKVPGVIPLNVYSGTGVGEAAAMQGFEMLLYGTDRTPCTTSDQQKWVVGSQGFKDCADFVYERSTARASARRRSRRSTRHGQHGRPGAAAEGKLAIALDGSWLSNNWLDERRQAVAGVEPRLGQPRCRPRTARATAR